MLLRAAAATGGDAFVGAHEGRPPDAATATRETAVVATQVDGPPIAAGATEGGVNVGIVVNADSSVTNMISSYNSPNC